MTSAYTKSFIESDYHEMYDDDTAHMENEVKAYTILKDKTYTSCDGVVQQITPKLLEVSDSAISIERYEMCLFTCVDAYDVSEDVVLRIIRNNIDPIVRVLDEYGIRNNDIALRNFVINWNTGHIAIIDLERVEFVGKGTPTDNVTNTGLHLLFNALDLRGWFEGAIAISNYIIGYIRSGLGLVYDLETYLIGLNHWGNIADKLSGHDYELLKTTDFKGISKENLMKLKFDALGMDEIELEKCYLYAHLH